MEPGQGLSMPPEELEAGLFAAWTRDGGRLDSGAVIMADGERWPLHAGHATNLGVRLIVNAACATLLRDVAAVLAAEFGGERAAVLVTRVLERMREAE